MGDISIQQRIERQRQRRQQRILESAESRLEKIKKFQSDRRSPSPEPKTENNNNTLAEHYPAPTDPRRMKYERSFQLPENNKAPTTQTTSTKSNANKYFDLLHFISMIWLSMLAMFQFILKHGSNQVDVLFYSSSSTQSASHWVHYPVFWYFIVIEFILHFSRLIYQPVNNENSNTQAPASIQRWIPYLSKHSLFFTNIYKDLFIVIFMVGFSSLCISALQ